MVTWFDLAASTPLVTAVQQMWYIVQQKELLGSDEDVAINLIQISCTYSLHTLAQLTYSLLRRYVVKQKELLGSDEDVFNDLVAFLRSREGQGGIIYARKT